jgi:hypothetical protein
LTPTSHHAGTGLRTHHHTKKGFFYSLNDLRFTRGRHAYGRRDAQTCSDEGVRANERLP